MNTTQLVIALMQWHIFKRNSDSKDEYYVFKMNNRSMNPDEPSYVFKTSKLKVNIAWSMEYGR